MKKRLHLTIRGRVQGVFYRKAAQQKARELDVTGWAKNLLDGSVEIVCEGEEEQLSRFLAWAKEGPQFAKVERVDAEEEAYAGEFREFFIREFGF